jgi:hypothetical protein
MERHPFLKRPGWKPSEIVVAGRRFKGLPPDEYEAIDQLLDQPGIPPHRALEILSNRTRGRPGRRHGRDRIVPRDNRATHEPG